MVKGVAALTRKLTVTMPAKVEARARAAMEKGADELVAMMKRLAPFPDIANSIGWTWGDAPKGAVVLAQSKSESRGLKITVYATDWRARWFEFGTAERVQKTTGRSTGRIVAHQFFFPSYRALRKRIKSRVTREMKRCIREVGGT